RGVEQLADRGPRSQQLFQVVEDEEQLLFPELAMDRVDEALSGRVADLERSRDRGHHERRIGQSAEIDEDGAVAESGRFRARNLERGPSLSGSSGSRQGDESGGREALADRD